MGYLSQKPAPRSTPVQDKTYSREMEALARQRGFKNARQMADFVRQREVRGGAQGQEVDVDQAFDWHPANIFDSVARKLREARR